MVWQLPFLLHQRHIPPPTSLHTHSFWVPCHVSHPPAFFACFVMQSGLVGFSFWAFHISIPIILFYSFLYLWLVLGLTVSETHSYHNMLHCISACQVRVSFFSPDFHHILLKKKKKKKKKVCVSLSADFCLNCLPAFHWLALYGRFLISLPMPEEPFFFFSFKPNNYFMLVTAFLVYPFFMAFQCAFEACYA